MSHSCDGDVMGLAYVMPAHSYTSGTRLPMYWNVPRPTTYEEYQANLEGNRRYYWLLLWFRSASQAILEEAVASGSIMQFLRDDGLWPLVSSRRWIYDWSKLPNEFSTIADLLPLDEVGTVLMNADRRTDLARWGHLVFNKALELVGKPP